MHLKMHLAFDFKLIYAIVFHLIMFDVFSAYH